jgi:hypothetical protein
MLGYQLASDNHSGHVQIWESQQCQPFLGYYKSFGDGRPRPSKIFSLSSSSLAETLKLISFHGPS